MGDAIINRKAQSVGLSWPMVWILPDDHYIHGVERAMVECGKNFPTLRIAGMPGVLGPHELGQVPEVGFFEFALEYP